MSSELPVPLLLCNKPLPWVDRCEHLGRILTVDGSMLADCREKRAIFIDSSVKVREMFDFAHPNDLVNVVDKYCSSFYGSNIWRLTTCLGTVEAAWKTSIKLAWNVHRGCRSYFLDHVLAPNLSSLRCRLLSRFHKFFISLLDNSAVEISVLARLAARDLRSNLGSNLRLLTDESGLNPWLSSPSLMKRRLRENDVTEPPSQDKWRLEFLRKLLTARQIAHYECQDDTEQEITNIINALIIN